MPSRPQIPTHGSRNRWLWLVLGAMLVVGIFATSSCGADSSPGPTSLAAQTEVAPTSSAVSQTVSTSAPSTTTQSTSTTAPPTTTTEARLAVELVRVVDGDTVVVKMPSGTEEKVRYIGIDTPETKHPEKPVEYMGEEATKQNERLLATGPLTLKLDVEERDRYGRLLAYVFAGEVFVNLELVRSGYAQVSTYPPNVAHVDDFTRAQAEAREQQVGLWAATTTTRPLVEEQPAAGRGAVYTTNTGEKYHRGGLPLPVEEQDPDLFGRREGPGLLALQSLRSA